MLRVWLQACGSVPCRHRRCAWRGSPARLLSCSLPSPRRAADKRKSKCLLPTWLLKHQHGLRGGVDRQRARPLHRAVAPAGHAVATPGVGKPEVLWEANKKGVWDVKWRPLCHVFIKALGSPLPSPPLGLPPSRSLFCIPPHGGERNANARKLLLLA